MSQKLDLLDILRITQPLAVLASFSLVLVAFLYNTVDVMAVNEKGVKITVDEYCTLSKNTCYSYYASAFASIMFFVSFVSSIILKLLTNKSEEYRFISLYSMIGFFSIGIVLLVFVLFSFIGSLGNIVLIIFTILTTIWGVAISRRFSKEEPFDKFFKKNHIRLSTFCLFLLVIGTLGTAHLISDQFSLYGSGSHDDDKRTNLGWIAVYAVTLVAAFFIVIASVRGTKPV